MSSLWLLVRRVLSGVRDVWIALGVAIVLLLVLDASYRGVARLRGRRPKAAAVDSALHPYAKTPWFPELRRDLAMRHNHFDPYRSAWPDPVRSAYVNVDTGGRRVTPQPVPDTAGVLHVMMLGGSVMWGYTVRDSFAIPALVAARLPALGVTNARVENFAQAAFNSTQEETTLALEVARGHVPDLVVALDGFNDIATALAFREAGRTYADDQIGQAIQLGRRGFWGELIGLPRHSPLFDAMQAKWGRPTPSPRRSRATIPQACGAGAQYFASMAQTAAALGSANDFRVVYFQQPQHQMGNKPLTSWEKAFENRKGMRECSDSIDAAMRQRPAVSYVPLRAIFDGDTATRFVDANSHLTEAADALVADRIATAIAPILRDRMARRPMR